MQLPGIRYHALEWLLGDNSGSWLLFSSLALGLPTGLQLVTVAIQMLSQIGLDLAPPRRFLHSLQFFVNCSSLYYRTKQKCEFDLVLQMNNIQPCLHFLCQCGKWSIKFISNSFSPENSNLRTMDCLQLCCRVCTHFPLISDHSCQRDHCMAFWIAFSIPLSDYYIALPS